MDKQKRIEEMARDINNTWFVKSNGDVFGTNEKLKKNDINMIAHQLICDGYRKIPENAVVLTREEYEELQIGKDFNYGYHNGESNMTSYYENIRLPEVRKETAEKFAERLKERLNEWLEDNEDLYGKINFGIAEIELIGVKSLEGEIISESLIDEICKEITEARNAKNE